MKSFAMKPCAWKICLGLSAIAYVVGAYRHYNYQAGISSFVLSFIMSIWAISFKK